MEVFTVEHVTFSYPNEDVCIHDISFSVMEGAFVLLLGSSGSGKTTLLKQLKPQLTPFGNQTGQILYCERALEEVEPQQSAYEIGYVFQNPDNQIVTNQVFRELAFGLKNQGISQKQMELRIGEVAHFFGLEPLFERSIDELSGGQKQMLNLASILVMNPKVILLDEPTSQLDPIAARQFLDMLVRVNQELGITIVLSEHRVEPIYSNADSVLVMQDGTLLAQGTPREVSKALLQTHQAILLPALCRMCKEANAITFQEGRNYVRTRALMNQNDTQDGNSMEYIAEKENETQIQNLGSASAIFLKQIRFRYARHLDDVIIDTGVTIKKGECFGIVGGNGSGKSTLLKIIGGYLKPYYGKVKIDGTVAYVPQNPQSLFSKDTVEQECKGATDELVELFDLKKLFHRHPYDLSGGEQQRLAFLIQRKSNPDIFLLDEPTKGLDGVAKQVLIDLVKKLKTDGMTIVLVSHDVEFVAACTDRCGMLFHGALLGVLDTHSFFMNNEYYTTIARRLTKGYYPGVVTEEEFRVKVNSEKNSSYGE